MEICEFSQFVHAINRNLKGSDLEYREVAV